MKRSEKVLMCHHDIISADIQDETDEDFELMKASIEKLIDNDRIEKIPITSNKLFSSKNVLAVASSLFGGLLFFSQSSQHVSGVALLNQMEKDSVPFKVILAY